MQSASLRPSCGRVTESSREWGCLISLNGFEDDLLPYDPEQSVRPPDSVFSLGDSPLSFGCMPQDVSGSMSGPLNRVLTLKHRSACYLRDSVAIEGLSSASHRTVSFKSVQSVATLNNWVTPRESRSH